MFIGFSAGPQLPFNRKPDRVIENISKSIAPRKQEVQKLSSSNNAASGGRC
jgi:hypothetical protein